MKRVHPLVLVTAILALGVISLGSFVRLSDAGLGCPDWPGCYGHPVVPSSLTAPMHTRAWLEMIHRYAAGTLGIFIFMLAWLHRREPRVRVIAAGLVALVIFQALLGMWTVTLKLMPLVVMGHLLGGMGILGLLWLWQLRSARSEPPKGLRPLAIAAALSLVLQIALGGWTSANYAAVACPDLFTCQGKWWPEADFRQGFSLPDTAVPTYEGGVQDGPARTAIHLTHRIGAVLALLLVGSFALALVTAGGRARRAGALLGAALLLQISLGLGNVFFHFPLPVAVAHTAGAALLLVAMITALRELAPSGA